MTDRKRDWEIVRDLALEQAEYKLEENMYDREDEEYIEDLDAIESIGEGVDRSEAKRLEIQEAILTLKQVLDGVWRRDEHEEMLRPIVRLLEGI